MAWHSKGFQVRQNKGVENSPPKTRRPRKTFILERIITPSALVPGGVDDHDALHQLLNSLSLLSFDFSDWAEKLNHATNLHLFADSGAGPCLTSPTPDGDLPPIIDFDPLGLHQPPTPTPGPNVQGAFDTLSPPIILPIHPPGSNEGRPQLYAGESTELTVLGDFADQKGVVLPASYLTYASLNSGVAPIDAFGKVTGLADGTSILSASGNNIQAVTTARVGEMPIPANDDEWNALLAEIYGKDFSVGMPSMTDSPGQLAVTSNATRAYVPLERTGRVAVVDLLARWPTVDDINLPNGASPGAISIGPGDNYAYIADSGRGRIYVLDIYPNSASYNQVVETISVDATSKVRQIAISSDGRKLFATATDGYIYAVNIDPEDQPSVPNSNPRKWREQIGKVLTPTGALGLAATPDPLKMVFTNGNPNTDGSGFGVLTVSKNPLNLAPITRYTNLTLTNNNNVFEVNEGVPVTVRKDGRYAFVAGRNSKNILKFDAYPLAGGILGLLKIRWGLIRN
jgi:hypothetical protein